MTGQIGWYILGRIRIRFRMRPISLNDRIRSILLNTALTFSTVPRGMPLVVHVY
jgi:hypothetical protein